MALSNPIVQGAVNAYRSNPKAFVTRRVSPLCKPQPVLVDPNTEKVTATGRRVRASALVNIGKAGDLSFVPGGRRTQVRTTFEEYTLSITPRAVETRIGADAYAALPDTIGGTAQAQIIAPLGSVLQIAEEMKFATAITTTANWTTGYTGTSGNRWSDANFDALKSTQDAVSAVQLSGLGLVPNVMLFSLDAWFAYVNNPTIRSLLGDNLVNASVQEQANRLAMAIMGPFNGAGLRMIVSTAIKNAVNNPQATETPTRILSNFAWLGYVAGAPDGSGELEEGGAVSIEQPSAMKTWFYELVRTDSYPDKNTGEQVFAAKEYTAPTVYDGRLGYYFSSIATA